MNSRCSTATVGVACAVALTLASCTAGTSAGDKAGGGGESVVLQMADYQSTTAYSPALEYFLRRVDALSHGQLRIKPVLGWGAWADDAQQREVKAVSSGKVDLAFAATNAFDTMGVKSFQALTAPLLIDSYALEDAVVRSDLPAKMMNGLAKLGVTGLALFPGPLHKPVAVHKPLLGRKDWAGITFSTYHSNSAAKTVRALGATPKIAMGSFRDTGLDNGEIQGFDFPLRAYSINHYEQRAPFITANVNLWPNAEIVLADPDRLSTLTDEQQGWLHQAAREAVLRSTALSDTDEHLARQLCAAKARFVNASAADQSWLHRTAHDVYASLDKDAQTKTFIAQIEALKRTTPPGPQLSIPADCTGPVPKSQVNDPLAGTWVSGKLTETQVVHAYIDAGGSEKDGHAFFAQLGDGSQRYEVITMVFHNGELHELDQSSNGGQPVTGNVTRYVLVRHHRVTFVYNESAPGPICREVWSYQRRGNTLKLHSIKPCPGTPAGIVLYGTFPFTRSNDQP
jgi:TRAP-type transport system periplasmic protein